MIAVFSALAICLATLGLVIPQAACADTWMPPETRTVLSANGEYRFTVEPPPMQSSLDYYADELRAQREGCEVERPSPLGLLERKTADGDWQPVWAGALVNAVAPVETLVADDGKHVATLDNWGSVGRGENVIVIYDAQGTLVRTLKLSDLLPQKYIDALPSSVSSTRWRSDALIGECSEVLLIPVVVPREGLISDEVKTVTFRIALETGVVEPPPAKAWEAALLDADAVNATRERARQEKLAYLREPLAAPKGCDMRAWHRYLNEAHLRLTPRYLDAPTTSTTVLFESDHPRHDEAVGWLRDRILDGSADYPREESVVSPCDPEALVTAFARIMEDVKPGSLANVRLYIAAPKAHISALRALIAPSGATLVWLDPTETIAQRPERIPGSAAEAEANKERIGRWEAETEAMLEEIEN